MDENYISLERAIERMYEVTEECGTDRIFIDRIIDELENLPSSPNICIHPQWIPVSERLPEKGQSGVFPDESNNVLVYREHYDEIRVGHYDYNWNEFYTVDDLLMGCVTHWMPLPEPPKEDN